MANILVDYSEMSNGELEHVRMELEKSNTELGGKRKREGTLEDSLDGYDALLKNSR